MAAVVTPNPSILGWRMSSSTFNVVGLTFTTFDVCEGAVPPWPAASRGGPVRKSAPPAFPPAAVGASLGRLDSGPTLGAALLNPATKCTDLGIIPGQLWLTIRPDGARRRHNSIFHIRINFRCPNLDACITVQVDILMMHHMLDVDRGK